MQAEESSQSELLFFETFSHEVNESLNLDLVQFPQPVYLEEVRIIPLGARVTSDFPGGVRLGATNPSKFHIDFFVNDLAKPGAATFENLGSFQYNQNDCIHLDCKSDDETTRQIPTDGLVLRGWYTTITLAVYGTFTKQITEHIIASPPVVVPPSGITVPVQITTSEDPATVEWPIELVPVQVPILDPYVAPVLDPYAGGGVYNENYENREFEFYPGNDPPKDPRSFTSADAEWNPNNGTVTDVKDVEVRERDWDRSGRRRSSERPPSREISRNRDRSSGYSRSRSPSREREYSTRSKRQWSRSPEYRSNHSRRNRGSSYERSRRDTSFERSPNRDEIRKRPRTPPMDSPRRSPIERSPSVGSDDGGRFRRKTNEKLQPIRVIDHTSEDRLKPSSPKSTTGTPLESPATGLDDEMLSNGEQFEPILSDEEIGDDSESPFEMDYDYGDEEEIIKLFNPYTMDLMVFENKNNETNEIIPLIEEQQAAKEISGVLKILQKFKARSDFFVYQEFKGTSIETKESWVNFAEHLTQTLNQFNVHDREKNDFLLKNLLDDSELKEILVDWMMIGLDFNYFLAQPQPGYKIRHIKSGARLVETLCCYKSFAKILLEEKKFNFFQSVFEIYSQNHMAVSIKLMFIKALHSALDSKIAIEYFLGESTFNDKSQVNGYQKLIKILQENPSTRIKFALKSVLKKINLYETLKIVQEKITKWFILEQKFDDNTEEMDLLQNCLEQIIRANTVEEISYSQPKRFLPVSSKFEIKKESLSSFQCFYQINALLESLLLLITHQQSLPQNIFGASLDLVSVLLNSAEGLEYLICNIETTNLLVKTLLQHSRDEENFYADNSRGFLLGIEIAFKCQSIYHLEAIVNVTDVNELIDHLHEFYSLTFSSLGKSHVVDIICMESNIIPLLNLIESERKSETNRQGSAGIKCKSPVLSYAVDLVDCVIRNCSNLEFLQQNGAILFDLVKNHEIFEPSVSAMLQEMAVYLKPLEIPNVFSYNDITPLCDLIKRSIEFITTFPGDLIMGLRIIKSLGISKFDEEENGEKSEHLELKYKFVILQFYSADGVSTIISILDKITNYFEQPAIHAPSLASSQGVLTTHILLPAMQILRKMLTYVIQCRNKLFNDLTAIEPILKVFNLMYNVPSNSPARVDANKVQQEVIKTLLAYTQPPEGVNTESVHKSLWTQMISEVVKYVLIGPFTFIPGLLVFSELLPLPLPVPTKEPLTDIEVSKLITERQLWSAHLHPQSTKIGEMIQTICTSSYPQIIMLLSRVCLQLSDLAPNMTLLVTKSLTELILNESIEKYVINQQLTRLFGFLASLLNHQSIKVSVLSILSGKLMDLLSNILTNQNASNLQENVHTILQILLDSEISMISSNSLTKRDVALACALPSKEVLVIITNSVLENIFLPEITTNCLLSGLRTAMLLTEHDVTMQILKSGLESKKDNFLKFLQKITNQFIENQESRTIIGSILEFLQSLILIELPETDELINIPLRTITLTTSQMISILSWNSIVKMEEDDIATAVQPDEHPFKILKNFLEIEKTEEEAEQQNEILTSLKIILDYLEKEVTPVIFNENSSNSENTTSSTISEILLPQAEGIVTQYHSRLVFIISQGCEERLSLNYWLNPPGRDGDCQEQVPCDLNELIRSCLPPETNITAECKRLLHLSASPQTARERTTIAPCYRTRRVEVEPTTGRPEKKIFVTPVRGRGFPRTPPTRGDLFRSRPPNTSRPPSLHVDDFLALETCGAQPTGPTGYNKLSREIISIRGGRGRGRGFSSDRGRIQIIGAAVPSPVSYRTNSPGAWPGHLQHGDGIPPQQHFRTATSEPVVTPHYTQSHFGGVSARARMPRGYRPTRSFQR